jgi:hypothetical protein
VLLSVVVVVVACVCGSGNAWTLHLSRVIKGITELEWNISSSSLAFSVVPVIIVKTQWSKQSDPSRVPNTLNMDKWNGDTVVAGLEMLRNVFRVATQEAEVEGPTLRCFT